MKMRADQKNRRRAFAFWLAVLLWAEGTLGSVCAAPETVSGNTAVTAPAEGEDPAPEETEMPGEGEVPAQEETEMPGEGEDSVPEETEMSAPPEETVSENSPDAEGGLLPEQLPGAGEALGEPPLLSEYEGSVGVFSYGRDVMSTDTGSITLQTPSTADIIKRYKDAPWSLNVSNSYSEKPSTKSPYKAGHLSDQSLNNALHLLNFIRYVAGIPDDVTLSEDYIEKTQAGALLNCVNNALSHTPAQPKGFPEDLYELGYRGCSSSNIAWNYGNIAQSLLNGWMYDGDSSNISRMGHRRWVLNPSMTQTGFGAAGAYSAMYAFDRKGSSITDYVAWPAQNMPIELMNGSGTPWTLSLGSDYQMAEQAQVTVTLKNASTGKTWIFSEKKQDGYFQINNSWYGMPNCIIFRPNSVSYGKNSQFHVTVTGLKDKEGKAAAISYSVNLFSLSDAPREVEKVTLNMENLHLLFGDTEEKAQGMLFATLTPSNAADRTLTWESLKPEVAAVDQNGVVKAVGVGETTITVTAANGKQAACTVKVSQYTLTAEGIREDKENNRYSLDFELQGNSSQGETKKLTVMDGNVPVSSGIQWTSENENVVTVNDGVITPAGVGEARVWADVENGLKTLSCEVKVENAELPTMQMRENALTMKAGESRQLRVYLHPADTKWENNDRNYIKWKSGNESAAVFALGKEGEAPGDNTAVATASETVSGNTVTVRAVAAGTAVITAEIVDEAGEPVGDGGTGKGKASLEVTVQQTAALPVEAERPQLIALTNTQSSLRDVELPGGWSWKYPDTSLTQFGGQRSKTFPALYRPLGDARPLEEIQPAETLLPVYFLTLESISVRVGHADVPQDPVDAQAPFPSVSVLKTGWSAQCYVNYSFEDALEQFEEQNGALKNNIWYKKQKTELLEQLEANIVLTSSNPQTISVNREGKTAVNAITPGEAVLKAELKLGRETFCASQKLTVAENVEAAFAVSGIEHFQKSAGGSAEDLYRYDGELSAFPTDAPKGINSRIVLTMAGVTKLTVKSSNSGVVAVKASTVKPSDTAGGAFEIPLTVKAAGTAEITVVGNDPAKNSRTVTLVVTDACPGISEETVTVNNWKDPKDWEKTGTTFSLYAAKDAAGNYYKITSVTLADIEKSRQHSNQFYFTSGSIPDDSRRNCTVAAKADTKKGTYKMQLEVTAGGKNYQLPITVKVVSVKPKCSVKQLNKLNLFYTDTRSLLVFDTEEKLESVTLTGCNYSVKREDPAAENAPGAYWLEPGVKAALNSVKKGTLKIQLEGWKPLEMPFTVGVEKKAVKISPVISTFTLYPKRGVTSAKITVKDPETLPWDHMTAEKSAFQAKGNYEVESLQKERVILLQGKNLNKADSFRAVLLLKSQNWSEPVKLTVTVKVNLKEPAIALEKKTLQLNANEAYKGYDAAATAVRWKNGGDILTEQGARVSVYCDPKDPRAKELVKNNRVIFSVGKENGCYQVKARLGYEAAAPGNYQYIVQAAKDGEIWKTPLTLKVVDTAPGKAVQITAKGSIDVLNRDGSLITLTPALKAVNGRFVTAQDGRLAGGREVRLTGRDAHLFRAVWSGDGKNIELRAKNNETLVIKYQYTVTPVLTLANVNGETEEITAPAVKFKVKQGSPKVTASPKSALLYSGAYNSVRIDMNAALKGADAPEIEKVSLAGNMDAFAYAYNKDGQGTLTMKGTGRAVKGKRYSLQFKVLYAEQADNVKPQTVRVTVKVK